VDFLGSRNDTPKLDIKNISIIITGQIIKERAMAQSALRNIADCPNDEQSLRKVLHAFFDQQRTSYDTTDVQISDDMSMMLNNRTKHGVIKNGAYDENTMGDKTKPKELYQVVYPNDWRPVEFVNAGTQSACFTIKSPAGNEYVLKNEVSPGRWNEDFVVYREFIGRMFMQYYDGAIRGPNLLQCGSKYIIETNVGGGKLLKRRMLEHLPQKERDDITFSIAEMLYYMHFNYGKAERIVPYLLTESFKKPFERDEYEPVVGITTADKFDEMMAMDGVSFSQGDPHGENMTYRDGTISIIDFGRCGKTDRRTDFATLWDFFGKNTTGAIMENYVTMHFAR
jgi:hypothetical protein